MPVDQSLIQYDEVISRCKGVFQAKNRDYGTAWRILRLPSLTDQIYIKASRIRTIEEQGVQKVDEGIEGEYIGIINYSLMALIQHELESDDREDLPDDEVSRLYDHMVRATRELFSRKNHDYGEIWRDMRLSSYTDLILMKILRIKQIEDNQGLLLASEGVDANYMDIINYSIFALIRIAEDQTL